MHEAVGCMVIHSIFYVMLHILHLFGRKDEGLPHFLPSLAQRELVLTPKQLLQRDWRKEGREGERGQKGSEGGTAYKYRTGTLKGQLHK